MMKTKNIINSIQFEIIIERLARQLLENHTNFQDTVLIGIQPRGVQLCKRIHHKLSSLITTDVLVGFLDITFYRDDFRRRESPIEAQSMEIDFSLEGKNVVLIDDVLYTGRSVRAAMDAILAFGRPKCVELLVMIDRKYSRHLPIQPNYVGKQVDTIETEKVKVLWKELHGEDKVILLNSEQ